MLKNILLYCYIKKSRKQLTCEKGREVVAAAAVLIVGARVEVESSASFIVHRYWVAKHIESQNELAKLIAHIINQYFF